MKILSYFKKHKVITAVSTVVVVAGVTASTVVLTNQNAPVYNATEAPNVEQTESPEPTPIESTKPIESTEPTPSVTPQPSSTPEPTVYEKYGVDDTVAKKFEFYYPTFSNHDHEAFVKLVAKLVSDKTDKQAISYIDEHARKTGLYVNGKYYSKSEKSSFIMLVFGSGKGLSTEPWADIL